MSATDPEQMIDELQAEVSRLRHAGAKEIAASAVLSACETDPANPDDPDTIMLTTGDLELIVRGAVESYAEARAALADMK